VARFPSFLRADHRLLHLRRCGRPQAFAFESGHPADALVGTLGRVGRRGGSLCGVETRGPGRRGHLHRAERHGRAHHVSRHRQLRPLAGGSSPVQPLARPGRAPAARRRHADLEVLSRQPHNAHDEILPARRAYRPLDVDPRALRGAGVPDARAVRAGRRRATPSGQPPHSLGKLIEAVERFVSHKPLRRVHECVFGILVLESEPVDPRL